MRRLVNVELRKMVDTRAGLWMLVVMSAISLVVVAAFLIWGPADEATFGTLLALTSLPARSCSCRSSASWRRRPSGASAPGS